MSNLSPERIDRDEGDRVKRLRREAKRHIVNVAPSDNFSKRATKAKTIVMMPGRHVLGYSNALTAGAMMMNILEKREYYRSLNGEPVQHVRDGKPLTEYGAKMLGVPWCGTPITN